MPLSSGYDFGYDYGQQYYSSQPPNSYGMLPNYNPSNFHGSSINYHNSVANNAFTPYNPPNFHGSSLNYHNSVANNAFIPYNPPNFHGSSMYPTYENLSVPAGNNVLNIKTESESEPNESIEAKNVVENSKNSPIANSDRSECSYSSKLEICSKTSELMDNSSSEHAEITFTKDEITSSEY